MGSRSNEKIELAKTKANQYPGLCLAIREHYVYGQGLLGIMREINKIMVEKDHTAIYAVCPECGQKQLKQVVSDSQELKIGDKVQVACTSGLGSGGVETVTDVITKYDEDTGRPYRVVCCGESQYYASTGKAVKPPLAYRITKRANLEGV